VFRRDHGSQKAGTLSGGEQQMLVPARAMMSEPHLLCLDEPSLGLAPMVVQDIFRTIRAINAAGIGILLVEQNARHALETAGRGYVLQNGSIIASGSCAACGKTSASAKLTLVVAWRTSAMSRVADPGVRSVPVCAATCRHFGL
jgi:ABC-type branched-subunit amino acid transport system ATPase component